MFHSFLDMKIAISTSFIGMQSKLNFNYFKFVAVCRISC